MSEYIRTKIYILNNYENYLINSYLCLTRIKSVHFLFILIEILLNIFQELDIFVNGLKLVNISNTDFNFNVVSLITREFEKLSSFVNLLSLIFIIAILDSLYLFIKLKKFKIIHIYLIIIINFL